ncbi:hypothetical protein Ef18B233LT_25320 [Escherichia fergusonii]|nr:hypothetical protein Ef18B233LT_25320 [Escherichia fergusonii]BES23241.1 hypothetical protein Ef18B269LT_25850 [Escherichia fergusonii]BES27808.1 hypothetical protein Ef22C021LT_25880 [Escherichia fergusonii]BES32386.1 hypothetical protein Ef22C036LT_25930 [Escherichia fergusonii]BES36965.1 hypothetical protein Ef22C037LT_25930 [Escherichia fergusonii]
MKNKTAVVNTAYIFLINFILKKIELHVTKNSANNGPLEPLNTIMNSNRIITQIDIVLLLKDQLQNKIQIAAYKLNEIGFIFSKDNRYGSLKPRV